MKATRCTVEGCTHAGRIVRGMCLRHYDRLRRWGELEPRPTVAERLAVGLVRAPNGCLEWTKGANVGGYGIMQVSGKATPTHRLAWELANGPIPFGIKVLHHCDNPPCAQTDPTEGYPDGHLFIGTQVDNMADMRSKGRASEQKMTNCLRGHPFDEANTRIYNGHRHCRACARMHTANYRAKQRAA